MRNKITVLVILLSIVIVRANNKENNKVSGCNNYVNIPDANFKFQLVADKTINTDGDNEICESEAEAFAGAIVVDGQKIKDLKGIEAFVNLTELICFNNLLTSLDLTKNIALKRVKCSYNYLTSLNVTKNIALESLDIFENKLTSLDLTQNVNLKEINFGFNQLNSLDLSGSKVLSEVHCWRNDNLTSVNIANGNNGSLKSLDLSYNPSLTCIQIDPDFTPPSNWYKSADANYSYNCGFKCTNYVNIPDANFKAVLIANKAINTDNDNEICEREAKVFKGEIDVSNKNISDLTGIEAFVNIKGLDCSKNNLTHLNVTNNILLEHLFCVENKLLELNLSKNKYLKILRIQNNRLNSLDVSENLELTNLACYYNQLRILDISSNSKLVGLSCNINRLSNLDLSNNKQLKTLKCQGNQLTSINIANGNNTNITYVNATSNPNLSCIQIDAGFTPSDNWLKNAITKYGYDNNCCPTLVDIPDINFKSILVANTAINTNGDSEICEAEAKNYNGIIDVKGKNISDLTGIEVFTNISYLNCSDNQLTSLDVSGNVALKKLHCSNNELSSLNISENLVLDTIDCNDNKLLSLDVSNNSNLVFLYCSRNQLQLLDVSNNTKLVHFYCEGNLLDSLDVTSNIHLKGFGCAKNKLTSLDITNNASLGVLRCFENDLKLLNTSNNKVLTHLICNNNRLRGVDVSKNVELMVLYCSNNSLTSLNVDNNSKLVSLRCSNNQLPLLDVSKNHVLEDLRCTNNKLSLFNVANGNNGEIITLSAKNNISLTCIQIDYGFTPPSYWQKDVNANYSNNCFNAARETHVVDDNDYIAKNSIQNLDSKMHSNVISIYPNPTSTKLNVISRNIAFEKITIYNMSGRKVLESTDRVINVSNLVKGVYTLKIQSLNKEFINRKFIKR